MLKFTTISMFLFFVTCSWGDPAKVGHTDPVEQAVTTVRRSQDINPLFGNGMGNASDASTSMGALLGLGLDEGEALFAEQSPSTFTAESKPKTPEVQVIVDNEVVPVPVSPPKEEAPEEETLDADGTAVNLVGDRVLPPEEVVQVPSVKEDPTALQPEVLLPSEEREEKPPVVSAKATPERSNTQEDSSSGRKKRQPAIARAVRLAPRVANAFNQIRRQVARMNEEQKNQMRAFFALQDQQDEIEKRLAGYHPQGGTGGGVPSSLANRQPSRSGSNDSAGTTELGESLGGGVGAAGEGLGFVDSDQLGKSLNTASSLPLEAAVNSVGQQGGLESTKFATQNAGNSGVSFGVGAQFSSGVGKGDSSSTEGSNGDSSSETVQGTLSPANGANSANSNVGKSVVGDGLAAWSAIPFERLLRLQRSFLARQQAENILSLSADGFDDFSGDSKSVIAAGVGGHWRWIGKVVDPVKSVQWVETIEKTTGLNRDTAWAIYYTALSVASLASLLFLFWVGRRWRQNLQVFFPISKRDSQKKRR